MNQLEQTIIREANNYLSSLKAFYKNTQTAIPTEQERDQYAADHAALGALLVLAHVNDSGMSPEAVAALQAMESEEAASFRGIPGVR